MNTTAMPTQFPPGYMNEYIGGELLGTAIGFLVVETVFMVLLYLSRYYAKGERANMSMEVFMTLAYLVCVGKITVAILFVKIGGMGHHAMTLPMSTLLTTLKLATVNQIVCPMTTSLSKLGILCLYHRILAQAGKWYRIAIRATFVLVSGILVAQVLVPFINCRPFSKTWNPQEEGSCAIDSLSLWRYLGIPNVFTTLIIVAIPVPALAKLHVTRHVKLGLCIVFCACVLGVAAAIMRVKSSLDVKDFNDSTFSNVRPLCWIIAESGVYLVAGVLPTLRPLVRKVFKGTVVERWLLTTGRSSNGSSGNLRERKWYQKETKGPVVETKEHRGSDATAEEVELARTGVPKTGVTGGRPF